MARLLDADADPEPHLLPNPILRRLGADHPEVALELERLLRAVDDVAALAERSVAEQGQAATLAWLSRIWREVDRELHWCSSIPPHTRHVSASTPSPRRRRDEIDSTLQGKGHA